MAEKTIFQKLYDREIKAFEIYRNDKHGVLAFLDAFPASRGHIQLVPKEPVESYTDTPLPRVLQLQSAVYLLMQHQKRVLNPERVMTFVVGYGVPHLHIHAFPSYERGSAARIFDFERVQPHNRAPDAELEAVQRELEMPEAVRRELDDTLDRYAPVD